MNKELKQTLAMKCYGTSYPYLNGYQRHAVDVAAKVASQYAYEYAERVIGPSNWYVGSDDLGPRAYKAQDRLREGQHRKNVKLSSHGEKGAI